MYLYYCAKKTFSINGFFENALRMLSAAMLKLKYSRIVLNCKIHETFCREKFS